MAGAYWAIVDPGRVPRWRRALSWLRYLGRAKPTYKRVSVK